MKLNMTKTIIQLAVVLLVTGPLGLAAQVIVGGETPDPSALLDVRSTDQGVLLPRLTTVQRDAIPNPAMGLTIFNTTSNCLEANLGTSSAPVWERMKCRTGVISTLDCSGSTITGTLSAGQTASGVSASVPYTGSNGGVHDGQTVISTGVTGLTATLTAGNFASGTGSLTYAITGTPASAGTASFALNMGGQICTLNVSVSYVCRAKVNDTDYKNFLCHNLGAANTSADPFTPTWEINGGYWQWGRLAQAAEGPTATDPKNGAVGGWNTTTAANGSWTDGSKTSNDPCPAGYRVPTKAQWDGVIANNTRTSVGTFNSSTTTNYGAGVKFGEQLMLPAAGFRSNVSGALLNRGNDGNYWSSTVSGNSSAWVLGFNSSVAYTYGSGNRALGLSVRCVAE